MARIVPDASFVAHALLPSQRTEDASLVFASAVANRTNQWFLPAALFLEWPSLVRKSVNRGEMQAGSGDRLFRVIQNLPGPRVATTRALIERAWEISIRSQQSDLFDSFGLAAAELLDAEFWTSDVRFGNATAPFAADRVKYIS